jgi:hypothetical protein
MNDALFERELEVFRTEYEGATQHFYADLAIHAAAAQHSQFHAFLNRTPLWWNTCLAALQTASIITIGRIFDQDTPHNLDSLVKIARDHSETLFSKKSLERRILRRGDDRPQWLDGFLVDAYEPTVADFRKIRRLIRDQRKIYEENYRDLRHRLYAHKVVSEPNEVAALFAKTNIDELKRLLAFLASLYQQLWALFFNGRPLTLDAFSKVKGEDVGGHITQQVQSIVDYILKFGPRIGGPLVVD